MSNNLRLLDLFRYYKGEPHQMAAVTELEQVINTANPHILGRDQGWYKTWTTSGKTYANDWEGVAEAGKKAGAKFPELVAAQWALESGWGKHTSGKHNYFGLKGSGSATQTQEFVNGQWITITAEFIDFPDLMTCVQYLVDRWYLDYKTYKGCNHAGTRNEAAKWLVKENYATDPSYATKLIKLMDDNAPVVVKPPEIQQQPAKLSPKAAFAMHLTPNIRLGEFALDKEERRFENSWQVDTAAELACFLERVRRNFGNKPIVITSGYRPKHINQACGGAKDSEHLFSVPNEGACDFYVDGVDINAVQLFCDKYWEHSVGYGAAKGFVHLGRRADGQKRRWNY